MSEEERKFLEIVDLKKGFGSGETRQEVLRGMNFSDEENEERDILASLLTNYDVSLLLHFRLKHHPTEQMHRPCF